VKLWAARLARLEAKYFGIWLPVNRLTVAAAAASRIK